FSALRLAGATRAAGSPPSVADAWTAGQAPTYDETKLSGLAGVRTQADLDSQLPGKVYVFNRYWNVLVDPTNPSFKVIAVHVTYSSGQQGRGVATVFTSVFN